jgi:general secretion pathway protein F/type IV pilus assembly protein PilC
LVRHSDFVIRHSTPEAWSFVIRDGSGMPTFQYTARDADGQQRNGVIQADSEAAVVRTLDQRALFPVSIGLQFAAARQRRGGRIKLRHLSMTYGQLSDLLAAGVPMLRALDILSRTTINPSLGRVFAEVRESVSGGETLADSLAKHPQVFLDLHSAMVRAGETAGFLEDVLTNLSEFLDRQDDLRSKVRGAMIYPVVLASVAVIAVTGMLIFLVPQFKEFLAGVPLPLPSRVLFAISDALRGQAMPVLGVLAMVGVGVWALLRGEQGRRMWAVWQLKIPVAGKAVRMVAITRFCRVLGTMLANGITILQALEIAKDAAGHPLLAEAIAQATEDVRAGEPLAEKLRSSGLFPDEITEMIAVGEESNQLEKVLLQIANAVERRTNRQVDAAVRLIEPLLLMMMAGMIGFIAVGLLYPIFTMAQTMR